MERSVWRSKRSGAVEGTYLLERIVCEVLEPEDIQEAHIRERGSGSPSRDKVIDLGDDPVEELGINGLDERIAGRLRLQQAEAVERGEWGCRR